MAGPENAKWTRLAALGLLLAGMAPAVILAAILIWGMDAQEDLIFLVSAMVIPFVGALLVWRFGAWTRFVAILATLLTAMVMFWTAFGLAQPASFFDFVPGILLTLGTLIAIGASIAALIAGKRGRMTTAPEGGERLGITIALGLVVVAAVVSGALNLTTRSSADAGEAETTVTLKGFQYGEPGYVVPGGTKVFVSNDDPFVHTFTVEELGIDESLLGAGSKLIDIPAEPGTYVLYCRIHTSQPEDPQVDGMATELTIL